MKKNTKKIVLLLVCSLYLMSCSSNEDKEGVKKKIDQVKLEVAQEKIASKENNALSAPVPVQYNALVASRSKDVSVNANPLLRYPTTQYKFSGSIKEGGDTSAYVIDPSGRVDQVKVGDVLGTEKAVIVAIEQDKIKLKKGNSVIEIKKG